MLRAWLKLFRPFTLAAPVFGAFLFGFLALHDAGLALENVWWKLFVSAFVLATANAASNVINQVYDLEGDKISKSYRPLPRGLIKPENALSFGVLLYGLALTLAFLLGTTYGVIVAAILFCTWIYSAPPFRLKQRFLLNNLAIATPRGMLGLLAAYSLFNNPLQPHLLAFTFCFAVFVFGANATKDFADEEADEKMGVKNFVTMYGARRAGEVIIPFLFLPFVLIYLFVKLGLMSFRNLWLLALIPLSLVFAAEILKPKKQAFSENDLSWAYFYIETVLLILVFVLANL